MSAPSVLHQMEGNNKRLLDVMLTNQDVCSLVMGLLGRIIYFAETEKRMPVEGITIDDLTVQANVFKARVNFSPVAIARSFIWTPKSEFKAYVALKAGKMAQALTDNPNLGKFFEQLVEALINYAKFKGFPFQHLQFTRHIITKDWVIVLEVARKPYV